MPGHFLPNWLNGRMLDRFAIGLAERKSRVLLYRRRGYQFEFLDKKLTGIWITPPNPNLEIEVRGDQIIECAGPPKLERHND